MGVRQVWELVVKAAWQSDVLARGQDPGTEPMSFSLLGAHHISARVASLSVAGRRAVGVVARHQASLQDALGLLFQVHPLHRCPTVGVEHLNQECGLCLDNSCAKGCFIY